MLLRILLISSSSFFSNSKGSRIQATVRKHLAPKYEKLIREGVVNAIRNFTLANNTGGSRVVNHEYKITLLLLTAWEKKSFA